MIQCRRNPCTSTVARSASVTEVIRYMIVGSGYAFEICLVTAITGRRSTSIPGCVTGNASHSSMRPVSGKAMLL